MDIIIKKSTTKGKKYDAIIDNKKTIHFGATGYSDYTIHKDEDRKNRYLKRHQARENFNNPSTAAFYATNILWNKPTLTESIRDTNRRFKNVHISMR